MDKSKERRIDLAMDALKRVHNSALPVDLDGRWQSMLMNRIGVMESEQAEEESGTAWFSFAGAGAVLAGLMMFYMVQFMPDVQEAYAGVYASNPLILAAVDE